MKKGTKNKALMIITFVAVIGFGAYAFADWGMGPGMMGGWGHHGPGWHRDGYGSFGYGNRMGNLSDDEIQQMNTQREAFLKATEDLRQKTYEKELALQSEFAKENPDAKKAAKIQKEISELRAQLDQKRIDHMIEMRNINPNAGRGFMGRSGMGYSSGQGGYCWR